MPDFNLLKDKLLQQGLDALIISKATNRHYLSGFTGSSGLLLITSDRNLLVTDFRYKDQAALQAPDFEIVVHQYPLTTTLGDLQSSLGLRRIGLEKNEVTLEFYLKLCEAFPEVEYVPVSDPAEEMRRLKSPQELTSLRKAVEIADKAFGHILDFVQQGQTEKEVAQELEFFMRRLGAERNAFDTIAASGIRSALPHGVASSKTLDRGDFLTLDFGAVYQGYHSDMTRTLVIGEASARQKEIYDIVLQAQEAVLRQIQPGMTGAQADEIARKIIREHGYAESFGHGLGHGVGLDIHEGPRLAPHDETVLQPGMVVSVEPGIYLSGWGGVRIEDLIIITTGGSEVLTQSPKNLIVVNM